MIKSALPAAVAALTLSAPAIALAQATQPMPITTPNPAMSNTSTTTTIPTQPQADPATYGSNRYDGDGQFVPPMIQQPDMAPVVALPPGAVWIPGQYNWDPAAGNYAWAAGQFVLPPRPNAQWIAGHWQQTPTSWIWLDGRWN
jgi:hypothetical protein